MQWRTKIINVDIHTGEIITNYQKETRYIVLKKEKTITYNENKTRATTTITNKCIRSNQTELKLD